MRRIGIAGLIAVVAALSLAGCGAEGQGNGRAGLARIRIALDWTPNTNHTGLYVALAKDWYRDAGLDVQILPYAETATTTLVTSGRADFGIASQDDITFARAAGQHVVSVMPITQRDAVEIGVSADSSITSPKQLDGKTYAGFGLPSEAPVLETIIKHAGGRGQFKNVTLNTAAYEAVHNGKADFTLPFVTWEGIEARLKGEPFRTFRPADYGVPNRYSALVFTSDDALRRQADVTRRFVEVTERGFAWAADHVREGAQILMDANPGVFKDERLVFESAELLADDYYRDRNGRVGTQSAQQWKALADFLYEAGALKDGSGKPLGSPPDATAMFEVVDGDGAR